MVDSDSGTDSDTVAPTNFSDALRGRFLVTEFFYFSFWDFLLLFLSVSLSLSHTLPLTGT